MSLIVVGIVSIIVEGDVVGVVISGVGDEVYIDVL